MLRETSISSPSRLVLEGVVPGATPEAITSHFSDPSLVTSWWAPEAEVDGAGGYVYRWPAQEWTLRGKLLDVVPAHRVRFTWAWDHEPLVSARTVLVTATVADGGSRITITHGDYGPDEEQERREHADGWQYFIGRLAAQFDGGGPV